MRKPASTAAARPDKRIVTDGLDPVRGMGFNEQKGNEQMPSDGRLDYIELPASDIAATKQFYGAVFGWRFTDYGPDYVAFDSDGREGGFNAERRVVREGGPLVVLFAAELDAMEARVKAAGAEILSHHEFPGGRRFHFRDPNGNEIAVWTKSG